MDNNTNQEVKEEVKEEVKKETESKKDKWKKFVFGDKTNKEPKAPLDKQDKLCYAGALFFLILALVPTLLRNFDPTYQEGGRVEDEEIKVVDVVKKMSCNKSVQERGYSYKVEIVSTYLNNIVQVSEFKYNITLDPTGSLKYEDIEILEYKNLSEIKSAGIANKEDIRQLTLKIDYRLDETLRTNEVLAPYKEPLSSQRESYHDNGYDCIIVEGSL